MDEEEKKIKLNNFELEMHLNEPNIILWSVIEELSDIQEFYISNIFDYIKYNKKANKHLIHQIERLKNLLQSIESEE